VIPNYGEPALEIILFFWFRVRESRVVIIVVVIVIVVIVVIIIIIVSWYLLRNRIGRLGFVFIILSASQPTNQPTNQPIN